MKNFINYYYNLNIYNISLNNGRYFFYNGTDRYMLKLYENNPNNLSSYVELSYQLKKYEHFFSLIINRDNQYITVIDNKMYVLLKLSNIENYKMSIFDIKNDFYVNVDNKVSVLNHFYWISLWENKIDYFEEWFSSRMDSYKNIFPLFYYFIGLAEDALLYLKETEKEEVKQKSDQLVVSHYRMHLEYELYDYYDPTNIIIDHASRDISEYIKSSFVNKVWDIDMLRDYLALHSFSKYGLRMILARILYPSFFFDYVEEMIMSNKEINLLYLENRLIEFEGFIKQVCLFLADEYNIPVIPWIVKKT